LEHHGVPKHLRDGLARWVIDGHPVGGFLRSCLENNFVDAICRAGADLTVADVRAVAKWIYNEAPQRCWGSPGVVKTWRGE
jgi:hypothetical protein